MSDAMASDGGLGNVELQRNATRDEGPLTAAVLVSLLRRVTPGWRSDIPPRNILSWLRWLSVIEADPQRRLKLTDMGRQWAKWIDWTPEALPAEPHLEDISEDLGDATETVTPQLPDVGRIVEAVQKAGHFPVSQIASLHAGLWANPRRHFAILTGVSGSGKTLLAREYGAALHGEQGGQYVLTVPVEPGWYDPSPLLGYTNPLNINEYVRRPFLNFLLDAANNPSRPYTVVLDEMNLSHPEQYMAPLLSAMETGDWIPLQAKDDVFDGVPRAVRYPRNLVVIGTVNMDETTHGLSDKVLDRAFVLEFWDIDLAAYPRWGKSQLDRSREDRVRGLLGDLMAALSPARLHFGWRVVDDILDYLAQAAAMDGMLNFDRALDDVISSKVLPKLRGEDSVRFRAALEGSHAALTKFGLPQAGRKIEELQGDLKTVGSARYWR